MSEPVAWNGAKPLTISNSEMQTFKSCRRKWYLTYYLELGLRRESGKGYGARELGTRIHAALHAKYVEGVNPITVVDEIYAEDLKFFQEQPNTTPEQIFDIKKEQDLAHAMLEGYEQWIAESGIDAGLKLVAAESVVEVQSGVPGVRLRGKMDQRWTRDVDGARLFRDFKTVAEFTTTQKVLPLDEQMKFYHLLEYLDSLAKRGDKPPDRTDGALYTMLRKVKRTASARPPFYMEVEVKHNDTELESMWQRVHRVIIEIVQTRYELDGINARTDSTNRHNYVVPPRPSRDCTWSCDFFAVCPMMDDNSNWKGLLNEYYTHVDPHERYNAQDTGRAVTE